eukprot:gb/GECG01013337.1/.p1 GENE.gb/GECG01013337.1/~~gb/GECG01013337.1/.p1  ORF type:complete len:158 (+),score=6.79 gb/GECG01013337.1/:1-474(+)
MSVFSTPVNTPDIQRLALSGIPPVSSSEEHFPRNFLLFNAVWDLTMRREFKVPHITVPQFLRYHSVTSRIWKSFSACVFLFVWATVVSSHVPTLGPKATNRFRRLKKKYQTIPYESKNRTVSVFSAPHCLCAKTLAAKKECETQFHFDSPALVAFAE